MSKDKVLIAYHAHCVDGFMAYVIASQALSKRNCEIYDRGMIYNEESYKELLKDLVTFKIDYLYVVDFSLPVDVLASREIRRMPNIPVIMDHHKTAFEMYFPGVEVEKDTVRCDIKYGAGILLDNNESGASLTWKHFHHKEEVPSFVKYVKDHDLWRYEYGLVTKHVIAYLKKNLGNFNVFKALLGDDNYARRDAFAEGKELYKEHRALVREVVARSRPFILAGRPCSIAYCPPALASDVGSKLAELPGEFGVTYSKSEFNPKVYKFSLRSIGDFDVSTLAKRFGGGGHKNAAGFEIELDNVGDKLDAPE